MPAQSQGFRRVGRAAVIVSALLLIALTWVGARDAIRAHRSEARARVQAELLTKAMSFEEQLRREFLSFDQTLRILEYAWQRDPSHFDLAARANQVVVLNDVSLQLFIADARGIVRVSTRPAIIGTDVSQRDYFRYESESPADDGKMFVAKLTQGQVTRLWQINLVRRLDSADGSFAGIIAASYDTNTLARFQRDMSLGTHGFIGLVSVHDGKAWTLSAQGASVVDLAATPLFAAMRSANQGNWQGVSSPDDVDRMDAFAAVPDRDLEVVVGIDRAEAMRPSAGWEQNALIFAGGISLLLVMLAFLLVRALDDARQRHEALSRERGILEATLTGMSDGIMMVDTDLRLMAWNQRFPEFTGVPAEILRVGLPMEDILRSQVAGGEFGSVDVEGEVARRIALLRSGAAMGTIERPRPSGRQLEIRRNPLPGGGFVTLYSDVTARRQAEERMRQAQTMAAVGRLTAGVAHDFNNLLISVSGNAEILHDQMGEDPEHARRLAVILQAVSRGSDLVQRLLAFARKQTLAPTRVDLNRLVLGMHDLLGATLGRRIKVQTKLDQGLWLALADPVQIEHAILNLAINARDAMPNGGTLTLATTNVSPDRNGRVAADLPAGDHVVVSVSDTGTGMSEDVLHNAFEPFFTTKPPGHGSGLGLSQVYGVANQLGGSVRIESKLGVGTTVSVLLPRAGDMPEPLSRGEDSVDGVANQEVPAGRRRQILVVDDEVACRETIAAMLEANGFHAVLAADGTEALGLIDRDAALDLLLADYTMPGMTGVELAREMRKRQPSVPVVFLTGGEGEWIADERWVLRKPFLIRSLIDIVNTALGAPRQGDAVHHTTSQGA